MTILLPSGARVNLDNGTTYQVPTGALNTVVFSFAAGSGVSPWTETLPSPASAASLILQIDAIVQSGKPGLFPLAGGGVMVKQVLPQPFDVHTDTISVNGSGFSYPEACGFNYTGGTGLATTVLSGAGNAALTVTPVIVNGSIASAAVVAGGAGYAVDDWSLVVDSTGTNGYVIVTGVAAGVVTAVTPAIFGLVWIEDVAGGIDSNGIAMAATFNGPTQVTAQWITDGDGFSVPPVMLYYVSASGVISNTITGFQITF